MRRPCSRRVPSFTSSISTSSRSFFSLSAWRIAKSPSISSRIRSCSCGNRAIAGSCSSRSRRWCEQGSARCEWELRANHCAPAAAGRGARAARRSPCSGTRGTRAAAGGSAAAPGAGACARSSRSAGWGTTGGCPRSRGTPRAASRRRIATRRTARRRAGSPEGRRNGVRYGRCGRDVGGMREGCGA